MKLPYLPMDLATTILVPIARQVDDLEKARISVEHRRSHLETKGIDPGLLIDFDKDLALLVKAEEEAGKTLVKNLRRHPLFPFVDQTVGIGDREFARLLGAIKDPYVVSARYDSHGRLVSPPRERTAGQLISYCGLANDAHGVGRRLTKGKQSNWNTEAKIRALQIARSCSKLVGCEYTTKKGVHSHKPRSPYRDLYDVEKSKQKFHLVECPQCSFCATCKNPLTKNKKDHEFEYGCTKRVVEPALAGSPYRAGHLEGHAHKVMAKRILRDIWAEARDVHLAAI